MKCATPWLINSNVTALAPLYITMKMNAAALTTANALNNFPQQRMIDNRRVVFGANYLQPWNREIYLQS